MSCNKGLTASCTAGRYIACVAPRRLLSNMAFDGLASCIAAAICKGKGCPACPLQAMTTCPVAPSQMPARYLTLAPDRLAW